MKEAAHGGGLPYANAPDFEVVAILALERVEVALIGFGLDSEQNHFTLAPRADNQRGHGPAGRGRGV